MSGQYRVYRKLPSKRASWKLPTRTLAQLAQLAEHYQTSQTEILVRMVAAECVKILTSPKTAHDRSC